MEFYNEINEYFNDLKKVLDLIGRDEINNFIRLLLNAYYQKSMIFVFGNGGNALTALHIANDLNKEASYGRDKRFRTLALTDNSGLFTAYANDFDYEDIFIEQLKNFLEPNDLVIGISCSGNSKNIIKAVEYANSQGAVTVGITGFTGGRLKEIAQNSVNANINDMQISEDLHIILNHLTVKIIKNYLQKTG